VSILYLQGLCFIFSNIGQIRQRTKLLFRSWREPRRRISLLNHQINVGLVKGEGDPSAWIGARFRMTVWVRDN